MYREEHLHSQRLSLLLAALVVFFLPLHHRQEAVLELELAALLI